MSHNISFATNNIKIKYTRLDDCDIMLCMVVLNKIHEGKALYVNYKGIIYKRFPVKTRLIKNNDNILEILKKESDYFLKDNDIVLVAESIISISEGRAFEFSKIRYGFLAKFLSKFVKKTRHGIGLGTPETMQLAINEVGIVRILFAAFISVIAKLFKISGMFYRIAGEKVRGIDGPTENTLYPYNKYASLIPKNPKEFIKKAEKYFSYKKIKFIIIDANDIGVNILGSIRKSDIKLAERLAFDNPLGQGSESTPFLICRS